MVPFFCFIFQPLDHKIKYFLLWNTPYTISSFSLEWDHEEKENFETLKVAIKFEKEENSPWWL